MHQENHSPKDGFTRPTYTTEEKMQAMALLRQNDYQIAETARQLGIHKNTIQRWKKQYASEIEHQVSSNQAIILAEIEDLSERNEKLYERVFAAKEAIVNRLLDIINHEDNIDRLQKAFRTLCDVDGTNKSQNNGGLNGSGTDHGEKLSIYQEIHQYLIQNHYESKINAQAIREQEE